MWPWPLTVWPQSPYSTHGETACEVSLRSVKRGSSYAPETIFSNPCIVTLTFDQKFHRANTWLMGRLNVKFHVDRCKGEAVLRLKPFCLTAQSLYCDLDLWPFDKIPPTATISNSPSYATEREAVMHQKPFSVILALWPWPLDPKVHTWLMGRLHVKFHEDRWKGEAVMHQKPFSVILALWPWPLTKKSIGPILDSLGDCMWSFMRIGVKGKQLCAWNHFT